MTKESLTVADALATSLDEIREILGYGLTCFFGLVDADDNVLSHCATFMVEGRLDAVQCLCEEIACKAN